MRRISTLRFARPDFAAVMISSIGLYAQVAPPACRCAFPVKAFVPRRSLRRLSRINGNLLLSEIPAKATTEQFQLFSAYQNSRHGDSEMARMTFADFTAMVTEGHVNTAIFELRGLDGRLFGCMLADRLSDGFSAVYSFYDTAEDHRSLGTQLILGLIAQALAEGPALCVSGLLDRRQPENGL